MSQRHNCDARNLRIYSEIYVCNPDLDRCLRILHALIHARTDPCLCWRPCGSLRLFLICLANIVQAQVMSRARPRRPTCNMVANTHAGQPHTPTYGQGHGGRGCAVSDTDVERERQRECVILIKCVPSVRDATGDMFHVYTGIRAEKSHVLGHTYAMSEFVNSV